MSLKFLNKTIAGLVIAASCLVSVANAGIIYSNDFESGSIAVEFSNYNSVVSAPNGQSFIGTLNNGATPTLNLNSLALHSSITIDFDIYGIRSLDGTDSGDNFEFFINDLSQFVDFYGHSGGVIVGPTTGRLISHDSSDFGYGHFYGGVSTYHYSITLAHVDPSISFGFMANTDSGMDDEAFGLDNVVVSFVPSATADVPEPSTLAIFALGMMGLASRRFKK
ncbi:PEP-CTERM sorting domain-containing protein [Colwellia sp. MB3u-70]|uniref:PEP-CTERM sorting domain-containing protein n=1 Tax=unclassified Colwellia TaxID=196834 RepID=UPI0015F6D50D|nr:MULTISPECIES: PEP-CTERM sorting domain-containing protein [unclassified Colwellia]MBA6291670.1 PEP-CTERM sorting domain-containing protein [Colwellia sp. MB3u-8]MBA6309151.1 PEP-CTERM sorting domain-containing protein [Colwellia sp. MB3u-70]